MPGDRVAAGQVHGDVLLRPDGPDALLPVAAGVAADDRRVRVPRRQRRQVHRRRFARQVAGGLDPGVLEDHGLQLGGPLHDRVELLGVGAAGHPELDADHRPVADAAVDLGEALRDVVRVDVHEAERPVVPVAEGLQHLVVLPAEVGGRRVVGPRHAHVDAQPGDAHAVGRLEEPGHPLLRRPPRDAGQVAVQVPDLHELPPRRPAVRQPRGRPSTAPASRPPAAGCPERLCPRPQRPRVSRRRNDRNGVADGVTRSAERPPGRRRYVRDRPPCRTTNSIGFS